MRRDAREMAFKIIFEGFFNENPYNESLLAEMKDKDVEFTKAIVEQYEKNKGSIEENVKKTLKKYKLDRVYKIDLALVYEAITEIEYIKTPAPVAINEVLEIAKVYSTEDSPKFLNGILSAYLKGDKEEC